MYSRWFPILVILLWLLAMGWLVIEKVVPPLVVGEPPNYRTILAAQQREPPVGWTMDFNGRRLGWALCSTLPGSNQVTEIQSYVHFEELPLEVLGPAWLRSLLRVSGQPMTALAMDVETTLSIDPLDRLERFQSLLRLSPLQDAIIIRGTIDATDLHLTVSSGDFKYETTAYLPPNALVGDALSPQTQLPGLRKGQNWTVPVYSPLRPLSNPLEILQARVERKVPITWGDRMEKTWLVVYHRDSGFSFGRNETPRGRLWVRPDGTVLKQEAMILDTAMMFTRLPDRQAVELAIQVEQRKNHRRRRCSDHHGLSTTDK